MFTGAGFALPAPRTGSVFAHRPCRWVAPCTRESAGRLPPPGQAQVRSVLPSSFPLDMIKYPAVPEIGFPAVLHRYLRPGLERAHQRLLVIRVCNNRFRCLDDHIWKTTSCAGDWRAKAADSLESPFADLQLLAGELTGSGCRRPAGLRSEILLKGRKFFPVVIVGCAAPAPGENRSRIYLSCPHTSPAPGSLSGSRRCIGC